MGKDKRSCPGMDSTKREVKCYFSRNYQFNLEFFNQNVSTTIKLRCVTHFNCWFFVQHYKSLKFLCLARLPSQNNINEKKNSHSSLFTLSPVEKRLVHDF